MSTVTVTLRREDVDLLARETERRSVKFAARARRSAGKDRTLMASHSAQWFRIAEVFRSAREGARA